MVSFQKFLSTSGEKDKFPPIQLETGQIWTAAASQKQQTFFKIQPLSMNGQARRFDHILKWAKN